MPSPGKKRRTGCPFTFALDIFGDRWSLLVIRDLMFRGKKTYGEFLNAREGIATNILADRLKYLEAEDIIRKSRDPDNRRRYIYRLTGKGRDLVPVMLEILCWSGRYDPQTVVPKKAIKRVASDRDGFAAEIRARLRDK